MIVKVLILSTFLFSLTIVIKNVTANDLVNNIKNLHETSSNYFKIALSLCLCS